MRLFTSNSDKKEEQDTLLKSSLLMLFSFVLICTSTEIFWRALSHTPSVTDDAKLWSLERKKIDKKNPRIIALIGASRIMTDLSTDSLRSNFPDYQICNLAITGLGCISALHNLAEDENFKGIVFCDVTEDIILKSDDSIALKPYFDCYKKSFGFNALINREISTFIQSNFVIFDPHINLILVAGYLADRHRLRPPRYIHTIPDRSIITDYSITDTLKIKEERIKARYEDFRKIGKPITTDNFLMSLVSMEKDISKIKRRGGEVVLIKFPVSGELKKIDDSHFPKELYWDKMINVISANTIHYINYKNLNGFNCPDYSHLDKKDVPIFSNRLICIMKKLDFFRKNGH